MIFTLACSILFTDQLGSQKTGRFQFFQMIFVG